MLKYSAHLHSANGQAYDKEFTEVVVYNDGTGTKTRGNYVIKMYDKRGRVYRQGVVRDFPRLQQGPWELLRLALNDAHERYQRG